MAATVTQLRRGSIEAQEVRINQYKAAGANMIYLCEPSQLPEFHRLIVEEVQLNPDPKDGTDIFQPSGSRDFALHLKALERLFAAAGGEWDHNLTGPQTVDRSYMSYRAVGWITREYGKRVSFRGDADMDLEVLKEQLVEDYAAKAKKGGKDQSWIDYCVSRDYKAKRDNRMKLVASDAKAVVIRKLLGVGGTYPLAVFKKPFVIVRCVVAPDYGDPETQKLLRQNAVLAATNVYGQAQPQLPAAPPFEMETPENYHAPETRTEIPEVAPEVVPDPTPVNFNTADRAGKIAMIRAKAAEINYPLEVITRQQMDQGEIGILAPLEDHPEDGNNGLNALWGYLSRQQAPADTGYPPEDDIPF